MPKGGPRRRAGRPRKPTELKVITGTFRDDRHGKEVRAEAPRFPLPPKFLMLDERQKRIWKNVGQHCGAWSSPSDWPTVWGLVRLVEQLIRCQEAQLLTDDAGGPLAYKHTIRHVPVVGSGSRDRADDVQEIEIVEAKPNPLVLLEVRLFDKLRPFIAMLGLSPVDRARMPKLEAPKKDVDPIAALQQRMKK
jgi:hypothetical protein